MCPVQAEPEICNEYLSYWSIRAAVCCLPVLPAARQRCSRGKGKAERPGQATVIPALPAVCRPKLFAMKYIVFLLGMIVQQGAFSQERPPVEVTPELQKKILQEIEKDVPGLKRRLENADGHPVHIEFALDTFRIEQLVVKWTEYDYADFGMRDAGYAAARLYDGLLNKYYRKLSAVLAGADKKALVQAQKAWLAFRDSETALVETISKEEYSGGGTMQQLLEASEYLNLVKERTIVLFEHYVRATQSH